jgi:hypothetical protein
VKHAISSVACAAALVASLAACGSGDDKSTLPKHTGGSSPSTTTASRPATTAPTATESAPNSLAAHSTNTYGGLKVIVNLPTDIPGKSRPSLRLFSDFLQGVGRTTARNKLDPSLKDLASADVVKERKAKTDGKPDRGIGLVTYTISKIQTSASGFTMITGCLDQSKIVHLHKDGTKFVDPNARKFPTLKMASNINRGTTGLKVTAFTFDAESPC